MLTIKWCIMAISCQLSGGNQVRLDPLITES
jgi:hypothetical protein